jgi:hypothetical protein
LLYNVISAERALAMRQTETDIAALEEFVPDAQVRKTDTTKRCGTTWRTCSRREFQALAASGRTSASALDAALDPASTTDDELADVLFDTLGVVLVCFKHPVSPAVHG